MKLPTFAKFAMKLIVGAGVNEVLKNIIESTTPEELTKPRQVMVKLGTYALTSVIAGIISDKVVDEIDEVIQEITTPLVSPSKEVWAKEEEPTPTENPVKLGGMTTMEAVESVRRASKLFQEAENGGKTS